MYFGQTCSSYFKKNAAVVANDIKTSVYAGAFGSMVEGQFQRSLHRVDSYKSAARLCRVRVKVSQPGNRRMLVFLTFKIFIAAFLSCVCQIRAPSEFPGYAASAPQEEHEEAEGGAV